MNQAVSGFNPLVAAPMRAMQWVVIALSVLLFAVNGYSILSISFAIPGILREWGINQTAMGVVVAMEFVGMAIGGVLLGTLSDKAGRRPAALLCLGLIVVGSWGAVFAPSPVTLAFARMLTGLGIGGLMPVATVIAVEFANLRRREQIATFSATGYAFGVVVAGFIATLLLKHYDWRSVFVLGAVMATVTVPLIALLMPESVEYLLSRQPSPALQRVNHSLKRLGYAPIAALPTLPDKRPPALDLSFLKGRMLRQTLLFALAYTGHMMTIYFIPKWGANILSGFGYPPSEAGQVIVWANFGGLIGCLLIALGSGWFGVRRLVWGGMFFAAIAATAFGQGFRDLATLSLIAAITGFFSQAAFVGFFSYIVQSYPTEVRTGAFGFVMGVGRMGAALSPVLAGALFQAQAPLSLIAALMGAGSFVALLALMAQYRWR